MLYLVPTPIGNLQDITLRAIDILNSCDLILCEDTRVSIKLLQHLKIRKPLKSFHQFNEAQNEDSVIEQLKNHAIVGLISDAGTPGISDPGFRLVKRCREEGIVVTAIPGPCAAITALSGCGLPSDRFQFIGFLPKKENALKKALIDAILYKGSTIAYESPHRLLNTLSIIAKLDKSCMVSVCRELTKKFEEYQQGTADRVFEHFSLSPPKGEIVLIIEGDSCEKAWRELSPEELVVYFMDQFSLSSKEAIKLAAETANLPKRKLYNHLKTDTES